MIDFSCCKVNIGLEIVSARDDGYHNIESIFYPIPIYDIIEIVPNKSGFELSQSGIIVNCAVENNLVYKAWKLINDDFDIGGVKIHLHKQIPMGAGLGGGSANAVKVMQILNKEFDLGLNKEKLVHYATAIGSDCPFFVYEKPMFAFNTGTDLLPSKLNLSDYYMVIIKPEFSVSTEEAYSGIRTRESEINLKSISNIPISNWRNAIVNRFENQVFTLYPELLDIKNSLYQLGALYASMSGSGSAIYALFSHQIELPKSLQVHFHWQGKLK